MFMYHYPILHTQKNQVNLQIILVVTLYDMQQKGYTRDNDRQIAIVLTKLAAVGFVADHSTKTSHRVIEFRDPGKESGEPVFFMVYIMIIPHSFFAHWGSKIVQN